MKSKVRMTPATTIGNVTAIRNERWEDLAIQYDSIRTALCSRDVLLKILKDSLPSFLLLTSCPGHVLKQRFLPASFDDGVAKGFRKAV